MLRAMADSTGRQLEYVVAVAQAGSITQAAHRVPPVTRSSPQRFRRPTSR